MCTTKNNTRLSNDLIYFEIMTPDGVFSTTLIVLYTVKTVLKVVTDERSLSMYKVDLFPKLNFCQPSTPIIPMDTTYRLNSRTRTYTIPVEVTFLCVHRV